jgi:hypothetical protein
MTLFIYPYRSGSNSVQNLANRLDAKVLRLQGSNFVGNQSKVVLNWGSSVPNEEISKCVVINDPDKLGDATNKLKFFNLAKDKLNIPEFTTSAKEAESWLDDVTTIVVREKLTGHSGEGIKLLESTEDWEEYNHNEAKMYVKYIPKKEEFRIHVMNGQIIDEQKKVVPRGNKPFDWKIRNHHNGFIFARNDIEVPASAKEQAIEAVNLAGLDFGAVDVIYNHHRKIAYVLEINSAPGLEGTTLDNYVTHISKFYGVEVKKNVSVKPEKKYGSAPTFSQAMQIIQGTASQHMPISNAGIVWDLPTEPD